LDTSATGRNPAQPEPISADQGDRRKWFGMSGDPDFHQLDDDPCSETIVDQRSGYTSYLTKPAQVCFCNEAGSATASRKGMSP
jgi:hypothetical protein